MYLSVFLSYSQSIAPLQIKAQMHLALFQNAHERKVNVTLGRHHGVKVTERCKACPQLRARENIFLCKFSMSISFQAHIEVSVACVAWQFKQFSKQCTKRWSFSVLSPRLLAASALRSFPSALPCQATQAGISTWDLRWGIKPYYGVKIAITCETTGRILLRNYLSRSTLI